ncbi:MAG: hypothetical protein PGN34_13365 [Methylobacterium frigidaeris]
MTVFWTILARRGVAAFLGLTALLLAVSAAQAGQGRVEPVLRAGAPTVMSSLHPARPVKLPLQVVAPAGGIETPRHDAEGLAGALSLGAPRNGDRDASVLLPPRRLGSLLRPGLLPHERPPKG